VKEVGEAWTRQRRRSVVPTVVLGRDGGGRADSAVPGHFDVEEERGAGVEEQRDTGVEAHTEDMEEGTWWRWMWTRSRSERRQLCGGKMKGLWFRGSGTLKKKNSSYVHDDIINICRYI
jgi:hypothetical protein